MLNDNAKALINKLQYIIDRFVKVRTYSAPKRIVAEPHNIEKQSDNKYIVFFGEIVSDKTIHAVNVYKEPTTEQPVPDFPEYVLVDRQPLRANECYVDRENNLLYFHSSQINCKVSVTYYSIGVGMLSSALIYTHFDSNNKVIETLYQLTRRCQEELDRISTVNDAEQLKVELRSYIDSLLELMRLYPNPKEIIAELETIVANADDLKFELGVVVEEAQRFLDELKTGSNKTVTITPAMWTSAGSGRYSYEYWHNLNTTNLIITTTQIINGIETSTVVDYEKTGNNKIKFYTSDNSMTIKVVMSASYFPGLLSGVDIGVISADNLTDGREKVAMTVEERNNLLKAQDNISNLQGRMTTSETDIVHLNEDIDGLNGELVAHKNEYGTFKSQTSQNFATINSSLEQITLLINDNLKYEFENLPNFSNVKLAKGNYNLSSDVIIINGKDSLTIDLTDCVINQTSHGYGIFELVNCKNIIIKGGKLTGRGDFPSNTFVGTTLYNEKRGLQGITTYEWEFFKNGELITTQAYNGGYIGNCGIGILINYGCENIIIEDVETSYFNYSGISIGFKATQDNGYNKNIIIRNCHSHHNFDSGIQLLNVEDYRIENNRTEYNGHPSYNLDDYEIDPGYGITLRGARKHSIDGIIKNNMCNNNNRKGIDVHSGVDFIIKDNIINNTPMCGISITQSNIGMLISRGLIENNVIKNCGYMESVGGFGQGVYLASEDYLIFSNNRLYNCGVNTKNIKANGITSVNGDVFIEGNFLINCGYSSDINVKSSLAKIVNNTIKDNVNTNDTKISIYAYTDDTVNSYLAIDKNYVNIQNGRGVGFQKFADGLMTSNKIIAPVLVSHVSDETLRANVRISEDNNLTQTVYKIEGTNGLDLTNTHSFEVTLTDGVLSHTGHKNIISSVTDNVNGFRINYTKELKNVGVALTIANSTTGLDLTNLYLRENTRNYCTIALGTTSNTAGVSSATIGKNLKILVMLTYI